MIIKRDFEIEDYLVKEIQNKFLNNERTGIHLSDLLSPKQAYWRKTKPMPPTKTEIIYWLSGQAHESVFLYVSNFKHGKAKVWNDIWYTPDSWFTDPQDYLDPDILYEMKTSRRGFKVKEGTEEKAYDSYLKQLKGYCAIEDLLKGGLLVWYLSMLTEDRKKSNPDFFCYNVEYTKEELEEERKNLIKTKALLETALRSGDISNLPDCEDWKCFKITKSMIEKPHCETCNREFKTDYGIKSHVNGKAGKGHKVKRAVYSEVKEPRCKYAEWCKPELYNAFEEWKKKNIPEEEEEE